MASLLSKTLHSTHSPLLLRLLDKPVVMFNITLFDGPSLGDCPGQAAGGGGHAGWELATAASVPSGILALIAVLIVVRQNLERFRALVDSVNQCLNTLVRCLPMRQDVGQGEVEMEAVAVQSPTVMRHPNLSDEERLRCQENRQRQDRMRWL